MHVQEEALRKKRDAVMTGGNAMLKISAFYMGLILDIPTILLYHLSIVCLILNTQMRTLKLD